MHLKDFNKIISESVFIVYNLTNKNNRALVYEEVTNQIYSFYKKFKEMKIIEYFKPI